MRRIIIAARGALKVLSFIGIDFPEYNRKTDYNIYKDDLIIALATIK